MGSWFTTIPFYPLSEHHRGMLSLFIWFNIKFFIWASQMKVVLLIESFLSLLGWRGWWAIKSQELPTIVVDIIFCENMDLIFIFDQTLRFKPLWFTQDWIILIVFFLSIFCKMLIFLYYNAYIFATICCRSFLLEIITFAR